MASPKKRLGVPERIASACVGSIAVSLLVTPLDVIKLRMQAQNSNNSLQASSSFASYRPCPQVQLCNGISESLCLKSDCSHFASKSRIANPFSMAASLIKNEGIMILWSGLRPTLLMSIPANSIYFACYESLRDSLLPQMSVYHLHYMTPMVSGAIARLIAATSVAPMELVRTQMQANPRSNKIGSWKIVRKILSSREGSIGLFRGLMPTLLRDIPFSCSYWTVYEHFTKKLSSQVEWSTPAISFVAGSVAGTCAAFVTTPFDVAKTHRQMYKVTHTLKERSNMGTWQILRLLWREERLSGIFAGVVPRCARIAPSCAIMISSYEMAKKYLS